MMSIWWVFVAFVAGGTGGLLLFALLQVAADPDGDSPLPTEFGSSD